MDNDPIVEAPKTHYPGSSATLPKCALTEEALRDHGKPGNGVGRVREKCPRSQLAHSSPTGAATRTIAMKRWDIFKESYQSYQ